MIHSIRWTLPKIERYLKVIDHLVYRRCALIPPFRCSMLEDRSEHLPIGKEIDDSSWEIIEPQAHWGRSSTDFVLRSNFTIPADWPQDANCALVLSLGEAGDFSHPEALVYVDGMAYATCDRHHQEVHLRADWQDGSSHTLALHLWTGLGDSNYLDGLAQTGELAYDYLLMQPTKIVQIDQPTRDFIAGIRVTLGAIGVLDENVPARGKLLHALNMAFKALEMREPFGEAFYASIPDATATLRDLIGQAGAPLDVRVSATGHAHIDVAWLWTVEQARHKAGRTFHTVVRLMEQFPEYHFTQSQPQLYDFVRQDYPELFEAIKQRVAEGRWEIIGGMWVEADCNLSGPESLARQFLLGRSFFAEHFVAAAETPVLWLPDVFGYAWALPQLIKQAGLKYFFTIKIGWNQYNRLPYDSFWWQGIDGTQVLTHFSTTPDGSIFASTYNAQAVPEQLMGTWTNFRQKDLGRGTQVPPLLMAYGFGDGGGGPTAEMLENIREMGSFPALPQIEQSSVGAFFDELESAFGDTLPTWNGELYLELHRGTYTTQGRNKRANRYSEFLLHDSEYLATQAWLLDPDYRYPHSTFRRAWELVCLNQFHDIIPGSSIGGVYVESQWQYDQIKQMALQTQANALATIAQHLEGAILIINPTAFVRADLAFWQGHLPAKAHVEYSCKREPVFTQETARGTWLAIEKASPFSITALKIVPGEVAPLASELIATPTLLENSFVRVELNGDGDITRIFDKTNWREVIVPGALANQFQAFEDRPQNWDAWDIDIFYDDKMWTADPATSVQVVGSGPLRAALQVERQILHSPYTQCLSLSYNSPRLDVETRIDWHERHILLKVAFPVDILSPTATYEIQWGNVQRPTHRNTSWDWARFETCAQKWVDLSEGNYGASLLNNGKYGHDIRDNIIRLSLLRSPTSPDPVADQGRHIFSYSLLPHTGTWNEDTIGAAYALNDPFIVYTPAASAPSRQDAVTLSYLESLIAAEQPNIVIETIKQAEDGHGMIVRLYESQRCRGPVTLSSRVPLKSAWHTNLLEQNEQELQVGGQQITFSVHPYEIVTLRLIPA